MLATLIVYDNILKLYKIPCNYLQKGPFCTFGLEADRVSFDLLAFLHAERGQPNAIFTKTATIQDCKIGWCQF